MNLLLSSGRGVKRVAAELGLSPNTLRTWRDRALNHGRAAQVRRLQRENDYLRRQREPSGAR